MLVQKLRLQRGWSQQQLAELSGLSVRTIQRIEQGSGATVETWKSLASVFEVDFQQLRGVPAMLASDQTESVPAADSTLQPASAPISAATDQQRAQEEWLAMRHDSIGIGSSALDFLVGLGPGGSQCLSALDRLCPSDSAAACCCFVCARIDNDRYRLAGCCAGCRCVEVS